jgi:hypothetical protein
VLGEAPPRQIVEHARQRARLHRRRDAVHRR